MSPEDAMHFWPAPSEWSVLIVDPRLSPAPSLVGGEAERNRVAAMAA
jgi:hypothetical protein